MDEFNMKTSDFMAIYRFSGVKLALFWSKLFKNEFWTLDLILHQI